MTDDHDVAVRLRQLHQAPAHAARPSVTPPFVVVLVETRPAALGEIQEGVPGLELRPGPALVKGPVTALTQVGPDLHGHRVRPVGVADQVAEGDDGGLEGPGER